MKKKDRIRRRHIDRRSEAIDSTDDLATQIEDAAFEIQAINLLVADQMLTAADPCDQSDPDPAVVALFVSKGVVKVLQVLAGAVAWGGGFAHDICIPPANQTVAGFNASTTCTATASVKNIVAGVADILGVVVDGIDMALEGLSIWAPNDTLPCVSQVGSDLKAELATLKTELKAELSDLKAGLEAAQADITKILDLLGVVQTNIHENREYIRNTREIVLTPHGQRKTLPLYEAPAGQ